MDIDYYSPRGLNCLCGNLRMAARAVTRVYDEHLRPSGMPLLNSGQVNFFGPNTPAIDAQIRATNYVGPAFKITSTLDSLQAKASRDLMQMTAGPLSFALGAEVRKEKYDFQASDAIQTGDVSGYGGNFGNVTRSRDVDSVFTEVNVPIVKGLEASGAVRFDRYQGVGNSTTPKASLRWQPTKGFLVRGSIGKGFRAPSLQDLYLPSQTSVTVPGLSDPARCPTTNDQVKDCGTQFPVLFQGTQTLKPERSVNTTLGMEVKRLLKLLASTWRRLSPNTLSTPVRTMCVPHTRSEMAASRFSRCSMSVRCLRALWRLRREPIIGASGTFG